MEGLNMFRKIFLLSLLTFSFSYAVDEIDIEKRREEQQNFDFLLIHKKSQLQILKNLLQLAFFSLYFYIC